MLCNLDRAREAMAREGLDALVATTPEHVLYLSDFETNLPFYTGTGAAAVLPRDPERPAVLVVAVAYLGHVAGEPTWMPELRCYGGLGVIDPTVEQLEEPEATTIRLLEQHRPAAFPTRDAALADALAAAGALGGAVGVDTGAAPDHDAYGRTDWQDARALFGEIRLIKTTEEIDRLRQASRINEGAFQHAQEQVRAGGSWREVTRAWRTSWAEGDGTPLFWGSGVGPLASQLFPERAEHRISPGELIRWEGGGTYRGYWADSGRSSVISGATAAQMRAQEALVAGSERARELIGPGMRGDDLCDPVLEAIRTNGLPDFPASNVWGHGVGLQLNERPRVRRGVDDPLQPGMVIAFETPYFAIGWGGLQVEDTYVITEDGAERLTTMPRDLQILDAEGIR